MIFRFFYHILHFLVNSFFINIIFLIKIKIITMKGFDELDYDLNFLVDSSEEKKKKKNQIKKNLFS